MVQPINYGIQAPSAFESLVSGLKLGTSLQEMQAQRQLKEAQTLQVQQKLAEEKRRRERMAELNKIAPNELSSRLGEFSDVLPHEMFNALRNYASTADETTLRNKAGQLGQMVMAAGSNDPDVLESVAQELMSAAPDEPSKKAISTYLESAKRNPKQFVLGQSIVLRQLGDVGVKIADSIAEQLSLKPGAAEDVRLKSAQAKIEEAKAKFAPQQVAADLGLTGAQTAQAQAAMRASDAAAKKSGADAAKAQREAEQMSAGVIPADKRPEAEGKMRQEYSNQTKVYQDVKAAYSRVLASREDAAGDLALIFNYMKMLDPGSVVREGEFATAQNAAGVPDRIWNLYNKTITGERLSGDQRKMFAKQAESLYKQALKDENTVRSGIERIAKGYGLNAANIFYTPTEEPPTAPATEVSGAVAQPPAPTRPAATTQPIRPSAPTQRSVDDLLNQYRSR
jgi:hypothetical protein